MATDEEMLAAITAAVDAMPAADRADGNKRALARWKALLPFLPKQEAPPTAPVPEATLLINFKPTDAQKQKVAKLNDETWAMIREIAPTPSPD